MSFSEKLRIIRKEKKYSLKEISENTGIPYRSLQSYELGVRTPSIEVLVKLSNFFEVTSDYLLDIDNINNISSNSGLSDSDEEFLKQNQEQLIQILKQKQDEINKLKKRIEELEAEKVDTSIS